MNSLLDLIASSPIDPLTLASVVVFVATVAMVFGVMATIRTRTEVRRRAAGIASGGADPVVNLRETSARISGQIAAYADRYLATSNKGEVRELRRKLTEAGFFSPHAGAFFFLARVAGAGALAGLCFVLLPYLLGPGSQVYWPAVWGGAMLGYLAPKFYLDRRIAAHRNEHRTGFPDFMDLLVVCVNAGLSMEAALERVGRELRDSYPSLSTNVYLGTLELRAGRTMSEMLDNFASRVGIEEASAMAALLQQSEELGSSVSDALRIYSDDMRHKRMSLAEEKAYSLPAKLSVPLMLCVFPVIIIVIMLPVYVRVRYGAY
jgi:tight adherence protein C